MTSPIAALEQCVILVGGLGTRLGALTAATPKPLLPVPERPFLETLLHQVARMGFRRVLLLAGFMAGQVQAFADETALTDRLEITVLPEPEPLGTGGALHHAVNLLNEWFLLLNGDSLFDFNWLALGDAFSVNTDAKAVMALRALEDCARFGVVDLAPSGRVCAMRERGTPNPGLVNGGVYLLHRSIITGMAGACSLERDVLPALASKGLVSGLIRDGFFLDIGVPDDFARAPALLAANARRGAVFFDRDGVLNLDHGHVGTVERFQWRPGAIEAVRAVNDAGRYAFVVTNQAGVAKGHYDEGQVRALHDWMARELRAHGAHIDDWRYCPFHAEATVEAYRRESDWRKPEPGMLIDLMKHWPVEKANSIIIGDQETDLAAGMAAGIKGHLLQGDENIADRVRGILA